MGLVEQQTHLLPVWKTADVPKAIQNLFVNTQAWMPKGFQRIFIQMMVALIRSHTHPLIIDG